MARVERRAVDRARRSRISVLRLLAHVADPAGGDQLEVLLRVVRVAEVGGEHPEADLVVVVELVERRDGGLLGEVELGRAGLRVGDARPSSRRRRSSRSTRAGLRWSCQSSRSWVSTSGSGTSRSVCGWSGSTPLLGVDRAADRDVRVPGPEAVAEDLLLVLAAAATKSMNCCGARGLVVVDPLGVEHVERVVGVERALLRVDRHERHLRLAGAPRPPGARRRGCRSCSRSPTSPRRRPRTRTGTGCPAGRPGTSCSGTSAWCRRSGRPRTRSAERTRRWSAWRGPRAERPSVLPLAA